LDDDASTKFTEKGLKQLAVAAGYTDLSDMMDSATAAGTSLTASFTNKVVRLGKDATEGGDVLKWVPVYLSRSEEDKNGDGTNDAVLTLWLANDVYASTWSDGTNSPSGTKNFNGTTVYSNTYDGSFIRHKLNGKDGWTVGWGKGSNQKYANDNIRTLVSNFYGSGAFAGCVTTPANVSWQANANYMRNDPNWAGDSTSAKYPCDWLNDNVWLPSVYEVSDSTVAANNNAYEFEQNGGLWQINKDICSGNMDIWLRTGYTNSSSAPCSMLSDFTFTNASASNPCGVRPAIHINLESALAAAEPDHEHVWQIAENDGWVVTKPATCSAKGEEERVCTATGCTLENSKETRETEIYPTAHGWGDWVVTKEATCTEAGEETKTCSYNSAHKETRPITASGHDYNDEFTVDTEATCTTAGSKSKHCKNCTDKIEVTAIPLLGHAWSDWQTVTEASCTSQGLKRRTCSRSCGVEPEEQAINATGHSYTDVVTDPTCTEDGYT
ncbi:MAG: hypothetical protein K2O67_04880, partial [Clostridia bacterium]|nr:hypothetical protein [Clostridia bacterium]